MIFEYPLEEFDAEKLLKHYSPQFSYEGECVGDEIHVETIAELRRHEDGVLCHVDIASDTMLLEEYQEFSEIEDHEEEYFIERLGKKKWQKILAVAKARKWEPDLWLSCAIRDNAVVLLVHLAGERIIIETGCVGGESERSSAYFEEGHLRAMPEIEVMIKKYVEGCCANSAARHSSRKKVN